MRTKDRDWIFYYGQQKIEEIRILLFLNAEINNYFTTKWELREERGIKWI